MGVFSLGFFTPNQKKSWDGLTRQGGLNFEKVFIA